jgi:hypothetical protein
MQCHSTPHAPPCRRFPEGPHGRDGRRVTEGLAPEARRKCPVGRTKTPKSKTGIWEFNKKIQTKRAAACPPPLSLLRHVPSPAGGPACPRPRVSGIQIWFLAPCPRDRSTITAGIQICPRYPDMVLLPHCRYQIWQCLAADMRFRSTPRNCTKDMALPRPRRRECEPCTVCTPAPHQTAAGN